MDVVSSCPASAQQTLELRGHLIDSLTLSKVIDRIQQLGGDYRLNDIRIGTLKKDISSVNLTVMAQDGDKLTALVEELSHYGALPAGQINVEAIACPADGELPPEAFAIKLPDRVYYEGQWLDLKAGECMGIVIYPEQGEARLEKEVEVRKGALAVSGTQGIEW
jgi:hypothetical protein